MTQKHHLSKFQEVIWREALHCVDETYAIKLLVLLPKNYDNKTPQSVFRDRPTLPELESALYQVNQILPRYLTHGIWTKPLEYLQKEKDNPPTIEKLMTQLDSPHWVERFVARHTIVHLGGEMVQPLINYLSGRPKIWTSTVEWLLENIALKTRKDLAGIAPDLLCPICVVMCGSNTIRQSWWSRLEFYGCQKCYQSREFIERPEQIVAVLDTSLKPWHKEGENGAVLRVNWLKKRTLFEFDQIEIKDVTDKDVELFALQVGNAKNRKRRRKYKKVKCVLEPEAPLSENTLRILRKTFGEVEQQS